MPIMPGGLAARFVRVTAAAGIAIVTSQSFAGTAYAQAVAETDASLKVLLESGYEIKAMQYLPQSMVFSLQNETRAFVCETNLDGQNTLCVELE